MSERLIAICGACAAAVAPNRGYLGVSHSDIVRTRVAEAEWHERYPGDLHTLEQLLEMPDDIQWHVYHFACDPHPEEDGYQIGTEQIRTTAALMSWSAHLMGKTWLPLTDWDELLREAAGEIPSVRVMAIAEAAA